MEICYIEGNHITMMDNDKIVAAINGKHIENVKKIKLDLIDDNKTSVKNIYSRS